jgi:hypothetical protein
MIKILDELIILRNKKRASPVPEENQQVQPMAQKERP